MNTLATVRPWLKSCGYVFAEIGGLKITIAACGEDGQFITTQTRIANSALICNAVNQFDALNAVADAAQAYRESRKVSSKYLLDKALTTLAAVRKASQ